MEDLLKLMQTRLEESKAKLKESKEEVKMLNQLVAKIERNRQLKNEENCN